LVETYKDRFDIRRYGYADAVKVEAYDALADWRDPVWGRNVPFNYLALPHPPSSFYGMSAESKVAWVDEHKFEPGMRPLLQFWGTDYRRNSSPFHWVSKLRQRLQDEKPQIALLSDMRFKNELYHVSSCDGYTVKLTRLGYVHDPATANHISETDLDGMKFDFEIQVPDGGQEQIDELKKDAVYVFEQILEAYQPKAFTEPEEAFV